MTTFDLPNGLTIDSENPSHHTKPSYCPHCGVFYYFGGHFCVEKDKKTPVIKRGMEGYFSGNDNL